MSDHYEIVISCFLDDNTPEDVLDTLRWHLGLIEQRPAQLDEDAAPYPFLNPDHDSPRLPGGEIARLQRQTRGFTAAGDLHAWGIYARTYYLDDDLGEVFTVLDLLAPHVSNQGYGGHIRDVNCDDLSVITFDGDAYEVAHRHPSTMATANHSPTRHRIDPQKAEQ
jgi:hypothetical protein